MRNLLSLLFVVLLSMKAVAEETPTQLTSDKGWFCAEIWITTAAQRLQASTGQSWQADGNGFFHGPGGQGFDGSGGYGSREATMWAVYTDEARYPFWPVSAFNSARVPGYRAFMRACLGGGQGGGTLDETPSPESTGQNGQPDQTGTSTTDTNTDSNADTNTGGGGNPEEAVCPRTPNEGGAQFAGAPRCYCNSIATTSGHVWGVGPYDFDSDLCRAAVHAGVIPLSGGWVTVQLRADLGGYTGNTQNGVTSYPMGASGGAFVFVSD